jgi:nucleoside-diphosphate-sugar epimerase
MSSRKKVVVFGANGRVARQLIRLLVDKHDVTGVVREPAHEETVQSLGAKSLVLTRDAPLSDYTAVVEGAVAVYYCSVQVVCSSGPDAPPVPQEEQEAAHKAEYDDTIKVYDAIEAVAGPKPRLIMLSGVDVRDLSKVPAHYDEEDLKTSKWLHDVMPLWMKWRYESDKALSQRTAFQWVILRPGGFSDDPGTGKVTMGRTHLMPMIPREDVAAALAALLDREDASGLSIDVVGGETPVQEALDAAIKKGETDLVL